MKNNQKYANTSLGLVCAFLTLLVCLALESKIKAEFDSLRAIGRIILQLFISTCYAVSRQLIYVSIAGGLNVLFNYKSKQQYLQDDDIA